MINSEAEMVPSRLVNWITFEGTNSRLMSATITAIQKCAFVLFLGVCLINGTLFNFFNKHLTPERTVNSGLSSLFGYENLDECKTLKNLFMSHRCINALMVIEDAKVLQAISSMSPYNKWHYLTIVRGSKVLIPYIFQISLVVTPLLITMLMISAIAKALQAFGIETPFARLLPQEVFASRGSSVIGFNQLAVISGFLISSSLICNLVSADDTKGCQNSLNLYCITSLSRTIFKDQIDPVFSSDRDVRFFTTLAKILSSIVLTTIIFYVTILLLCLGIYITMDAVSNVWETGCALLRNISSSSPTVIQTTWNHYVPNFKDLCHRLVQMNRDNQDASQK